MDTQKKETVSFLIRFNQNIFENAEKDPKVQWRCQIQHVQTGEDVRFIGFDKAVQFMQEKLAKFTLNSIQNKPEEEQKDILTESFNVWNKINLGYPKMILESIKDPLKPAKDFQDYLNDWKTNFEEKIEINQLQTSSKADINKLIDVVNSLSKKVDQLNAKVDQVINKG